MYNHQNFWKSVFCFCNFLNFYDSRMKFYNENFWTPKCDQLDFVLPSSIKLTVFEKNEFLLDMFVFQISNIESSFPEAP